MTNIAIFASGTGSNARKLMEYFEHSDTVRIALVVSNKKDAGVIDIAASFGVPTVLLQRASFYETRHFFAVLAEKEIDFIVLAGFLWLIPTYLVEAYPNKIVNIHPALLPKYGGKGMYGMHVHEAVRAANDTQSGITIHYVNDRYDEGDIIFQAACPIADTDTPTDIARKVQMLEHEHFARVVDIISTK